MAIPTGGLNQVSAQPKSSAPAPAGGAKAPAFDVNAAQAENLEKIEKPNLRDVVSDELGDQREALNRALVQMRESLDTRKNRLFDPVLMQTAAGFLKPTKSGSFGESLGYAAENASAASERESVFQRENQKLEMELLGKEQELRRQMGGDQFLGALLGGADTAPAPAGGAVKTPTGGLRVPGATSPVDVATASKAPTSQQVLDAALDGRIKITDRVLALAEAIDPKKAVLLEKIRKLQIDQDKNIIERDKYEATTRKVKPLGGITEREMDRKEYAEYQAKVDEANAANDEQILFQYYRKKGWLESNQLGSNAPLKPGETAPRIPRSKSQAELDAEAKGMSETQASRAKASEDRGNLVLERGENSIRMEGLANDVLSLTESNAKAFNLMQNATVRDSLLRAIEQGASVTAGPMTVALNLPVRVALQGNKEYQLTKDDIAALQLFQQKQSAITAEMRKMARTPGEGATDKSEGQLYAAIGILPTDSAKVLALKSEAMIQRARYDSRAAELWSQFQEDNPNKSFTYFRNNNQDFKQLQGNYVRALDDMREKNADTLRSPKKSSTSQAPATSTPAPANETPLQKFKREKAEREARGGQ